jgi:AcrR family transcriptional regulator
MGRKSLKPLRQKEIIKAFYKVARKEGLENASIAKVAAVLKVNPSLVIHYFETKQDLILGLIEYILERYRLIYNPENGTSDPEARLRKIISNLFSREWNNLFDDGVFFSCYALIFRNKTIKVHYKTLHDQLRRMLADALHEAKENGVISVKDVANTADMIFVLIEGAYYYLSLVTKQSDYNKKLALYERQALVMLDLE